MVKKSVIISILFLIVAFAIPSFGLVSAGSCNSGVPVVCDAGFQSAKCPSSPYNDGESCPVPGSPTEYDNFYNQHVAETSVGDGSQPPSCHEEDTYTCGAQNECNYQGEYNCINISFYEYTAGESDGNNLCDAYQCASIQTLCAYVPGYGTTNYNWWVWGDSIPGEDVIGSGCTDGHDNDCNGYCDVNGCNGMLADPLCGCPDEDGDGFGVIHSAFCEDGGANLDCDDDTSDDPANCPTNKANCDSSTKACAICIYPGATEELGDGLDQNCDGISCLDQDSDGHYKIETNCPGSDDCDDRPAGADGIDGNEDDGENRYPGRGTICENGVDEDCDGSDEVCTCDLTDVSWGATSSVGGESVSYSATGTGCSDSLFHMLVYEYDGGAIPSSEDDLVFNLSWITLSFGDWFESGEERTLSIPWKFSGDDDGDNDNDREYFLEIEIVGSDPDEIEFSGLLNVSEPTIDCTDAGGVGQCSLPDVCEDGHIISGYTGDGSVCCDQSCCTPLTCANACGSIDDTCGGTIDCGNCDSSPNGYCISNSCCYADFGPGICTDNSYECGTYDNNCGMPIDCGGCLASGLNSPYCYEDPDVSDGNIDGAEGKCYENDKCTIISDLTGWDRNEANNGEEVFMLIYGSPKCANTQVDVEIWEKSTIQGDREITEFEGSAGNPDPFDFDDYGLANGSWIAEYFNDYSGNPEYYFIATTENLQTINTKGSSELEVKWPACDGITACDDYETKDACDQNNCRDIVMPYHESQQDITCGAGVCDGEADRWYDCGCVWNELPDGTGSCGFEKTSYDCGGNSCGNPPNVWDRGEDCDGNDLGVYSNSCEDHGLTGAGPVTCNDDCTFNYTECNDVCNHNDIVDVGEQCEPRNLSDGNGGTLQCKDFPGYDGGKLACTDDCRWDRSGCTWSEEYYQGNPGKCLADQLPDVNECDEDPIGFYTATWKGEWIWNSENGPFDTKELCENEYPQAGSEDCVDYTSEGLGWRYDPEEEYPNCDEGGTTTIECPAERKLSFFSYENFIIAIAIIGIVYVFVLRRKAK